MQEKTDQDVDELDANVFAHKILRTVYFELLKALQSYPKHADAFYKAMVKYAEFIKPKLQEYKQLFKQGNLEYFKAQIEKHLSSFLWMVQAANTKADKAMQSLIEQDSKKNVKTSKRHKKKHKQEPALENQVDNDMPSESVLLSSHHLPADAQQDQSLTSTSPPLSDSPCLSETNSEVAITEDKCDVKAAMEDCMKFVQNLRNQMDNEHRVMYERTSQMHDEFLASKKNNQQLEYALQEIKVTTQAQFAELQTRNKQAQDDMLALKKNNQQLEYELQEHKVTLHKLEDSNSCLKKDLLVLQLTSQKNRLHLESRIAELHAQVDLHNSAMEIANDDILRLKNGTAPHDDPDSP